MPSLTCFNFRFTPSCLMLVLASSFILLFSRLGFWQIQRAHEKEVMVATEQALAKQKPIDWKEAQKLPVQYQRINVQGVYLPDIFFLDNQHYQHRFGYDVLSALLLENGAIVMVDRGWITGNDNRLSLPQISIPSGFIRLQGSTYFPSKNQWILGPGIEKRSPNITIIELLDTKLLSQILQKKVYPFIIRLFK